MTQTTRGDTKTCSLWWSMSTVRAAVWSLAPEQIVFQALTLAAGRLASVPPPRCQAATLPARGPYGRGDKVVPWGRRSPKDRREVQKVRLQHNHQTMAAKVMLWFLGAERCLYVRTRVSSLDCPLVIKEKGQFTPQTLFCSYL